jgi:hypothetical protein
VIVSVPHGAAAGNLLRTGIISRLLDADSRTRLVIVSPMAKDAEFVREVSHPRVAIEELPPHRPAGLEARLLALMQAGYLDSEITESVRVRRAEALANGTVRWIAAKRMIASVVAPSMLRARTRYSMSDRFVSHPWADALFERLRPSLLVTSSPGLIFAEVPLLRTAVRRRVTSMAIDPSWDNFTNKVLPVRRVDRLIVWNELMKRQAVELHGYHDDEIRVAGTPQWDLYFQRGVTITREEFCRQIGADPACKLVTVTTTPRELYAHHDHVLRVLHRAIRDDALGAPAQVLVRLHPRDDLSHYRELQGTPGIILEKPFRSTVRAGDGLAVDVTAASQQHLADTLHHSDVIVNVASTIAVEAAIFDTPVVNISFDGEAEEEWTRSAQRYYRFTHYVNVTRHNAVRVATTPEQLVQEVAHYLTDPGRDREGRRAVVREQCQFTDGRAAERVASYVVEELARVLGSRPKSCAA